MREDLTGLVLAADLSGRGGRGAFLVALDGVLTERAMRDPGNELESLADESNG